MSNGFYPGDGPLAPPQNLEAEQSVLGAVLLSDSTLPALEDEGLIPEMFYRESHGLIFKTMMALYTAGEPVDALTLVDRMNSDGTLAQVGGAAAVELLAGSVPAVGNLRQYAKIVRRKAVLRWRLWATYEQQAAVWEDDDDAWSKAIVAADAADLVGKRATEVDPAEDFVRWYEGVRGLPTPYEQLTAAIGGAMAPGEITVIGAWPGFGKTIMSDTFVLCVKRWDPTKRCHIYVNELGPGIRTARMLARMTGIPWQNIRDKKLDHDGRTGEWERIKAALPELPAKYEQSHGWHVEDYVRHIRRKKWDLAVIDSASRIPVRDTHELEQAVGALADVAGETGCHLILLVQLNLERCKQLERPMPLGRDLLGGGAWYRDARNVLFVHREQETRTILGQEKAVPTKVGMIYADKATHGEPEKSMVQLEFNAAKMVFETAGGSNNGGWTEADADRFEEQSPGDAPPGDDEDPMGKSWGF